MDMLPSITIMTDCIAAIYAFDPLVWKKTKHEAEMIKFLLAEMQSKSTIQKRSQFPAILTKYAVSIRDSLYGQKETFSCGINIQVRSVRFRRCTCIMLQFNFILAAWFKFYFPLFLSMVIYDNEFKTKGNKIQTKAYTEQQHTHIGKKICSTQGSPT